MTTSEKRRPGRPPAGDHATTSTERMRVLRQKKRDEEARQLAAERAEERRRREAHTLLRQSIGKRLAEEATYWHFPHHHDGLGGIRGEDQAEMREYAARLAEALKRGSTHLPE